jgi:tRNA(Ile2) C34 agmatinyltransferase TiaS
MELKGNEMESAGGIVYRCSKCTVDSSSRAESGTGLFLGEFNRKLLPPRFWEG